MQTALLPQTWKYVLVIVMERHSQRVTQTLVSSLFVLLFSHQEFHRDARCSLNFYHFIVYWFTWNRKNCRQPVYFLDLDLVQSLHLLFCRRCSQKLLPPQSLHSRFRRLCSQKALPPQSLQLFFRRLCSQKALPPQSLHWRFRVWPFFTVATHEVLHNLYHLCKYGSVGVSTKSSFKGLVHTSPTVIMRKNADGDLDVVWRLHTTQTLFISRN